MAPASFLERENIFLFLYSFIAIISFIGPGASLGYPSIALPVLTGNTTDIALTESEIPFFASIAVVSQIAGCLFCLVTMRYGRRIAIIVSSLFCTVGWIVIASSHSVAQLFIGRLLTGFSAGLASAPSVVYLGEISTPRFMGLLTSSTNVSICLGIVMVYVLGFVMRNDWRSVAIFCILPPLISGMSAFFFLPESPRWLLTKGRKQDAKKCLLRIRGLRKETAKFEQEFIEMTRYNDYKPRATKGMTITLERIDEECLSVATSRWSRIKKVTAALWKPEVWKPFLILNGFFFFQQFSGVYVTIMFAVDIIVGTGITVDPFLTTVALGFIQVFGGIVNVCCSTRVGRRSMAIISGAGMAISLGILALEIQFYEQLFVPVIPLICIVLFVAMGSFGFLTLPWAMIGELFPTKYVNVLGPLTTFLAGIYLFVAVQSYPAISKYGSAIAMFLYSSVAVVATIFTILVLPETLGKSKTEIEERFKKKPRGET